MILKFYTWNIGSLQDRDTHGASIKGTNGIESEKQN